MKKLLLLLALLSLQPMVGQKLELGLSLQKTHTLYWENGISAQYSFANFKPANFKVGLEILSSRIGTAWGTNALNQEHYILSAAWFSHYEKPLHFVSKLKLGYFSVDLEEDFFADLPSSAIYIAPEFGLAYDIPTTALSCQLSFGYLKDFMSEGESPGTLQPLHYNFRIFYAL